MMNDELAEAAPVAMGLVSAIHHSSFIICCRRRRATTMQVKMSHLLRGRSRRASLSGYGDAQESPQKTHPDAQLHVFHG
jgi:hypothetical protein